MPLDQHSAGCDPLRLVSSTAATGLFPSAKGRHYALNNYNQVKEASALSLSEAGSKRTPSYLAKKLCWGGILRWLTAFRSSRGRHRCTCLLAKAMCAVKGSN